eukprot:snap_masked-scaffold_20-processed-gene-5.88-mRNA-1 protein AED:0.30 eAED:0.30 QI:0/-1/0/1/-1/1/1/0/435
MHFNPFKKKKTSKHAVEALSEALKKLPSLDKAVELNERTKEDPNELILSLSRRSSVPESKSSADEKKLKRYATSVAKNSSDLNDFLSKDEVSALNVVGDKLAELVVVAKKLKATSENNSSPPQAIKEYNTLVKMMLDYDFPYRLSAALPVTLASSRSNLVEVFNMSALKTAMLEPEVEKKLNEYIELNKTKLLDSILANYTSSIVYMHAGKMFRKLLVYDGFYFECFQNLKVIKVLFKLVDDALEPLLISDILLSFRELLQEHRKFVSEFLLKNYNFFFPKYNKLIDHKDEGEDDPESSKSAAKYITQRQSLNLLSFLLLDKQNYQVMIQYIGDKDNLILIMKIMRRKEPSIKLEAFHVFKIFAANPNKTKIILEILFKNKEKLIRYLSSVTTAKDEEMFNDERNLVIKALENLKLPEVVETNHIAQPSEPMDTE